MAEELLFRLGFVLIVLGIVITFIVSFLMTLRFFRDHKMRGGAIILIGPFPLILGSDARIIKWLAIVTIVMAVVLLLLTLF